jgi:4,5-dihydroxyphthalate decarboxylase
MPEIKLSMAISDYDHVSDILHGRVRVEGVNITAMELPIEEIFFRMISFGEFDVSEFSMAKYVSMVGRGTAPFRAIPVFPSRVFRQSAFYIRPNGAVKQAVDLSGKRVGVPEWAQTAGIYARAYLQHQCGVRLADVHWVQAGVNDTGRKEKVSLALPNGIQLEHVHDRSLNEMLLAGDLDAVISAREPPGFFNAGKSIERLWPDYGTVEKAYFRETGIFPIMHVVVIKSETLESNPWLAMNLFRAFDQAKVNSLDRLSSIVNSRVAIPWLHEAYDHARAAMGTNFWPYGIEGNRTTLEAFLQFCQEQGVTHRRVAVEELFPDQVQSLYKV